MFVLCITTRITPGGLRLADPYCARCGVPCITCMKCWVGIYKNQVYIYGFVSVGPKIVGSLINPLILFGLFTRHQKIIDLQKRRTKYFHRVWKYFSWSAGSGSIWLSLQIGQDDRRQSWPIWRELAKSDRNRRANLEGTGRFSGNWATDSQTRVWK